MRTYSADVREAWGIEDFSVRIGLNEGRVAVGLVGAGDPQVLALGDPVNVAARLQSAAAPGTIVVGSSVARTLSDRYSFRPLGRLPVKGRIESVDAYELQDVSQKGPAEKAPRFVGRASELEALAGVLAELSNGRGQIGVVVGEGGIGKTRLLGEAKCRASSNVLWLDGRCDPIDQRLPYEPFVQPVRTWLGVDEGAAGIEVRVRLASRGRPLLGGRYDEIAPHLARLLGVTLDPRLDRRLEGFPTDVLTTNLISAYREWLCALAARSPVVLAIDNLDSGAEATASFADAVLPAVEDVPLVVLLTMRRVPASPGWKVRTRALAEFSERCFEMPMRPLSDSEAAELVASLDMDESLDDRLRRMVVGRADGNPLYIEELVATVSDPAKFGDLPRALESLLLSRIDGLSDSARDALQASAVLGREFNRDVLARMEVVDGLDAALHSLLRAEIVRERGTRPRRFAFRHGLIREVALATLSSERFRQLNAAAARALTNLGAKNDSDIEALGRHLVASGDIADSSDAVEELADRMALIFRYDEALQLLETCIHAEQSDVGTSVRLRRRQAECLIAIREFDKALAVLEDALKISSDGDERTELQLARAKTLAESGRLSNAYDLVDGLSGRAQRPDLDAQVRLLKGRIALEWGDLRVAAREALSLEGHTLAPTLAFELSSLRAGVYAFQGNLEAAEEWALRSEESAVQSGSLASQLVAKRHVALICLLKGCVRESYELTKQVYDQYVAIGFEAGQLETSVNLAHLSSLVGELDVGSEVAESALLRSPGPYLETLLSANLAGLKFESGEVAEAEAIARRLLSTRDEFPSWTSSSAHLVVVGALLLRGDQAGAAAQLQTAVSAVKSDAEIALMRTTQAEVMLSQGNLQEALSFAQAARALAGRLERVVELRSDRVCALVEAMNGSDDGRLRLEANAKEARRMGLRLEEARALVALGSLDPDSSEHHFAEAQRIFEACGCRTGLAELEDARRGVLTGASS